MNNLVSTIFKVLAWIVFIGGFIAGILLGKDSNGDFSFGVALVYWTAFFVAGMIYYGFAEIIQLLTDIRDIQLLTDIRDKSSSNYSTNPSVKSFSEAVTNSTNTTKSTKTTTEESNSHLWRCNSCGNMISENPCQYCNNDVQPKENSAPFWCGRCGKEGPYDGNCPNCGSSLKRFNVKR